MGRGGRGGGRGGGRKPFRGRNKGRGGGGGGRDTRTDSWADAPRENAQFESYYRDGGFLEASEFEEMWKALKSDLPNSFRFTGTKSDALAVREIFKQRYIPNIAAKKFEGQPVQPPEAVNAFPDELVWHMKVHKKIIRRHAPFSDFQKFLVAENESGNISRQEVVSMIPPHFLDVKPGMVVLDMCAAPGSKSAQIAEMIHGDEEERVKRVANGEQVDLNEGGDYSDHGRSTGLLIANDTDYKRAGMLVHQVKRLNFPNLIVTQHDASIYPSIELPTKEGQPKQYLKFDRILADVPCSGDGTARKNINLWQKWNPRDGLGLHNLQLRILCRGLQMLKKGGRLVYSTCSMNPVENEAVVATAIQLCGGLSSVKLVDVSDQLPDLKRKPGLNAWNVMDISSLSGGSSKVHVWETWEDYQTSRQRWDTEEPERQFSTKITAGCFTPISKSEEEERIPLERCVRIYPHLQDTGAFFVAVLEKLDDIKAVQVQNQDNAYKANNSNGDAGNVQSSQVTPEEDAVETTAAEVNGDELPRSTSPLKRKFEESDDTNPAKKGKLIEEEREETLKNGSNQKDDPVLAADGSVTNGRTTAKAGPKDLRLKPENQKQKEYFEYLAEDDSTIASIFEFFGISDQFPRDRFMVKNKEGLSLNKIYYTSEFARSIISLNKDRGMKFIHCGVVVFVSHKAKDKDHMHAPWRLQAEGIRILEPWASKRIINCPSKDILYELIVEMFRKLPNEGDASLGDVGTQCQNIDVGCCFVRVEKDESQGIPFRMVLPLWRHPNSVNLMIDKDDRRAMLLRLWNETDVQLVNHVAEKLKQEETAKGQGDVAMEDVQKEQVKEIDDSNEKQGDGVLDSEIAVDVLE